MTKLYRAFSVKRTRERWLTKIDLKIRTSTADKSMRITWPDDTSVHAYFTAKGANKSQIAIQHVGLPDKKDIAARKEFWAERLTALVGFNWFVVRSQDVFLEAVGQHGLDLRQQCARSMVGDHCVDDPPCCQKCAEHAEHANHFAHQSALEGPLLGHAPCLRAPTLPGSFSVIGWTPPPPDPPQQRGRRLETQRPGQSIAKERMDDQKQKTYGGLELTLSHRKQGQWGLRVPIVSGNRAFC